MLETSSPCHWLRVIGCVQMLRVDMCCTIHVLCGSKACAARIVCLKAAKSTFDCMFIRAIQFWKGTLGRCSVFEFGAEF